MKIERKAQPSCRFFYILARKETDTQSAYEIYREIIKDNISYDILMQDMKFDGDRLFPIVFTPDT